MKNRIQAFSLTDVGRTRKNNQDACAVFIRGERLLMVVADGVGGNKCGEIASRLAVETLKSAFEGSAPDSPRSFLVQATEEANQRIRAYVGTHPECRGMATTLVAALIQYPALHLIHAGDSRAYLLRRGLLKKATEDHTLVRKMVKEGLLTPEEAKRHPKRHVIVNALGISDTQPYDYTCYDLEPGDQVLLCSDGLYDELPDEKIRDILLKHEPKTAVRALVDEANASGGHDNISITLAVVESAGLTDTKRLEPLSTPDTQRNRGMRWLAVALILCAMALGAWIFSRTPVGHRARKTLTSLFRGTPSAEKASPKKYGSTP